MADLASFQYQFNRQSPVPSSAVAEVDDFRTSGGFTRPDPIAETRQVDPAAENRSLNTKLCSTKFFPPCQPCRLSAAYCR